MDPDPSQCDPAILIAESRFSFAIKNGSSSHSSKTTRSLKIRLQSSFKDKGFFLVLTLKFIICDCFIVIELNSQPARAENAQRIDKNLLFFTLGKVNLKSKSNIGD